MFPCGHAFRAECLIKYIRPHLSAEQQAAVSLILDKIAAAEGAAAAQKQGAGDQSNRPMPSVGGAGSNGAILGSNLGLGLDGVRGSDLDGSKRAQLYLQALQVDGTLAVGLSLAGRCLGAALAVLIVGLLVSLLAYPPAGRRPLRSYAVSCEGAWFTDRPTADRPPTDRQPTANRPRGLGPSRPVSGLPSCPRALRVMSWQGILRQLFRNRRGIGPLDPCSTFLQIVQKRRAFHERLGAVDCIFLVFP